jgi:DNA polymerase-3 subunit gamma/tau
MSQALYRKYRPKGWTEVIGQEHVVQTLKNAIVADRVGHAYLFAGPRGTGKTTVARILAKAVNCLAPDPGQRPCNECENCLAVNENRFMDLIEMDAASNTGVDDVRELRGKIGFSPSQGKFKIHIIDEVHMLSTAAFNALLKTLEEPPPHAIFVLATTEIHKIPATVLSRCQRHEFRRVPADDILGNLKQIAVAEGIKADADALLLIARQATGSIRDAQSLLDQLSSTGVKITFELAQNVLGTATSQTVLDLVDSIHTQRAATGLETIRAALDAGADPRTLARQIVEYFRGLMLIQMGTSDQVEATKETKERMEAHAGAFSSTDVLRMIRSFNYAAADTRGNWQPSLALELALAEAFERAAQEPNAATPPAGSVAATPRPRAAPAAKERPTGPSHASMGNPRLGRLRDEAMLYQVSNAPHAPSDAPEQPEIEENGPSADRQKPTLPSLPDIAKAWKDVRAMIKPTHPAVEALLNSCRPVDVRGDELLLGFQSETVRALMDKPENLEVAGRAIAQVLGSPLRIRCVVTNARGKMPPDLPQDGMVATALNHGGQIVDVQE